MVQLVLLLASFACGALVVSAFWPLGSYRDDKAAVRRLAWVLLAPLEFAAIWLALTPVLLLLLWLFVFGDNLNDDRINAFARLPAALIAVVTSASVAFRFALGAATRQFARTHLIISIFLLLLYGGIHAHEYIRRIDGVTAERAAQSFMARYPADFLENARLVERDIAVPPGRDTSRYKCYLILVDDQPKVRFTLFKRGWLAWSVSSSRGIEPAQPQLDRAKRAIRERDFSVAELVLTDVIEDYPGTDHEVEARGLLKSFGGKTRRPGT